MRDLRVVAQSENKMSRHCLASSSVVGDAELSRIEFEVSSILLSDLQCCLAFVITILNRPRCTELA
jgi:hypothetical protein